MKDSFNFSEKHLSQIPALQLLIKLGYQILTPEETLAARSHKSSNVLLETILQEQLKKLNHIVYKGQNYLFSEENIQTAIQRLKTIKFDGLVRTNEQIYDMLTLGIALEQSIEGNLRSYTLNYINWSEPEKNVYHVCSEFSVQRNRSSKTARPDLVLFVNGIPLCVIECKSPKIEVEQAVSQNIRNQHDEYIPKLFTYTQLLIGVNKNEGTYATTGTPAKFWGIWKEQEDNPATLARIVNKPLSESQKISLFAGEFIETRPYFDKLDQAGDREVTQQDQLLYSLCRPERLLELSHKYTLFDGGYKKIARYQQYFVVRSALKRIKKQDQTGRRQGGVVWHTQGSGKSLSMVMLARNLALEPSLRNPRIVLVTDRDDLDKQLGNTFAACGFNPQRARTGRHLVDLVKHKHASIITTIINKFAKAMELSKSQDLSPDIFMLVDESHRTNYGTFAARMRQMFPNACYIGFTGTPLLKIEKSSFAKFGGLIDPHYSINQAVEDKAVVPLLYEGRMVDIKQNKQAIDLWFERFTAGLSASEKADLKRKYAKAEMLNRADQVIYTRAFDISEHFRSNWQGSGFKAQLVAPSKAAALKYHEYLEVFGYASSAVVISPPDMRESFDETDDAPTDEVVSFWEKMMQRYGDEAEYTKQIINQFKHGSNPEILIVVSKLLTGFDAPRNVALYLCKTLKEHTLLQAIARVNRLYDNKDYGYIIDYAGVLGSLDQAMTMYAAFEEFDETDIEGTLTSINTEIEKLPQKHSNLWDVFKEIKNTQDEEAFELLLVDNAIRDQFYDCYKEYAKTLGIALSAEIFLEKVSDEKLKTYKADLKRFRDLKVAVAIRYADQVNYKEIDPKIKKLIDTHIQAEDVYQLNEPVNIFDDENFNAVKEDQGVYVTKTTAAKADAIAHAIARVTTEKMDEDPAFYSKFSKLIQAAIDAFHSQRISELEYLKTAKDIREAIVTKRHDDIPEELHDNENAMAYYGIIDQVLLKDQTPLEVREHLISDMATRADILFWTHWIVQFWDNKDAQNRVKNDLDDYLFDVVKGEYGVDLSTKQMDDIISKIFQVAKFRTRE